MCAGAGGVDADVGATEPRRVPLGGRNPHEDTPHQNERYARVRLLMVCVYVRKVCISARAHACVWVRV